MKLRFGRHSISSSRALRNARTATTALAVLLFGLKAEAQARAQATTQPTTRTSAIDASQVQTGMRLCMRLGCVQCHSINGAPSVGPTFKDDFGSGITVSDGSHAIVDETYVRRAILAPGTKLRSGFSNIAPSYAGRINDEQIGAIVAYLKTLSAHTVVDEPAGGVDSTTRNAQMGTSDHGLPATKPATTDATAILRLKGDASRGKAIFGGIARCGECHRAGSTGSQEAGPDLSHVGAKYTKSKLLDKLIDPNTAANERYFSRLIQLSNGDVVSGYILRQDASEVVIVDEVNSAVRVRHLPREKVRRMKVVHGDDGKPLSGMPRHLLERIQPEGIADLLEFLETQK